VVGTAIREHANDRTKQVHVALVAEAADVTRVLTWAELWRETTTIAAGITTAVGPDGVILIEADNGVESVLSLLGALSTELPVAVICRRVPDAEKHAFRDALLADGHDVALLHRGEVRASRADRPCRRRLLAESLLLATGGSGGKPKIVIDARMRTVGARPRATRPSSAMNWQPGQRQLVIGPLYHTAALTYFIEAVSDGNTVVIQRVFDPARSVQLIDQWGIEWLQLTPYHMRLLGNAVRQGRCDLSSINGMLHLSAPCPEKVKRNWIDLLGGKRVFEMYGATEPVGVTLARGDEWVARPGTVGKGFFTQIRILDEAGHRLPPGCVGDVYMRSGALMAGYLDPEQHLRLTADRFSSVGDKGRLDADGYLYLEPRQVRRIQIGGETVYADEVESVLVRHPHVIDAAVIGIPDERLGETLVAVVVPTSPNVGGREVRDFARHRLARHKVPRNVIISNFVPRNGTGKLNYQMLADILMVNGKQILGESKSSRRTYAPAREDERDERYL
jgi:bile acid-coenzyme A ligase